MLTICVSLREPSADKKADSPERPRSFLHHPLAHHITMLLHLIIPIIYLAISILTFHFALHCHSQTHRYYFLPFFLLFASLSIEASTHFTWIPGLTSLWTQAMVLNISHVFCLLYIRKWPVPRLPATSPPLSRFARSRHQWEATYRLWGNPQLIGVGPNSNTTSDTDKSSQPISVFLSLRLVKLPIYYYINFEILPALVAAVFGEIYPEDVSEEKQMLLRRWHEISTRDFLIRAYVSILWVWQSVVYLDGSNAILASFFVSIGLDRPCDWPPLFGSPSSITSLRTFWSRFWHKVALQPYTCIGRALARQLNFRSDSYECKVFVAFVVFGLSGVSHGVVSWQIGRDGWTDVWWFMVNFLACSVETIFLQHFLTGFGYQRVLKSVKESWFGAFIGRIWVFTFFYWSVPKWQYPAMYKDALQARQLAVWSLIFSKMTVNADRG